jgi:hypothetical protein
MWYRQADKNRPSYELKIIGMDAEYAIRNLLFLQGHYNPSDVEISRKIKRLISHLENKYGSIANVRLFTKSNTLQELISENVYELFGKVSNK